MGQRRGVSPVVTCCFAALTAWIAGCNSNAGALPTLADGGSSAFAAHKSTTQELLAPSAAAPEASPSPKGNANSTKAIKRQACPLSGTRSNILCCTDGCPTPAPTPTRYSNSIDHSRRSIESAGSGSDIVLNPGQTGTISFSCLLADPSTGTTAPCDNGTTDQFSISGSFGGGITEAWNPTTTIGAQYTALTITPSLATQPGTYTTTVEADITSTDQNVSNPLAPPLTISIQVARSIPTSVSKGPFNDAIAAASQAAFGESTQTGPACPDGAYRGVPGSCACAWEVNRILNRAGVSSIGANPSYVPSVESALGASRGTLIPISSALPGDLAIENSQGHMGICMTAGCTHVYSNSTSHQHYINDTGPSMFESASPRIYRVEN